MQTLVGRLNERDNPLVRRLGDLDNPRSVYAARFPSLGGELPITGGWGYTKDDACVIEKSGPGAERFTHSGMFDGYSVENVIVEKRLYLELITSREGDRVLGLEWKRTKQSAHMIDDKVFDHLEYAVSGFLENDWESLKNEWEKQLRDKDVSFDLEAHDRKRNNLRISFTTEYWFEVTSFFGQDV